MKRKNRTSWLYELARAFGNPLALFILMIYTGAWFMLEHENIGWDGWLGAITMAATIIIVHSQNRSEVALHVKLDEIVRSLKEASNDVIEADEKTEEEIVEIREAIREEIPREDDATS